MHVDAAFGRLAGYTDEEFAVIAPHRRIGIQEFRRNATELIREVRESGSDIVLTEDGEPIAVVRPYTVDDQEHDQRGADDKLWAEIDDLAREIAKSWTCDLDATEVVSEQRD